MKEGNKSLLTFIVIVITVIGMLTWGSITLGNKQALATEKYVSWKHACIEASGVPVTVLEYVKGIGTGNQCVKISEKIEAN